jgi:putative ABC transport system permease protein
MYFVAFILKNLTRRPIRTVLTVLGLAVAVGSMIGLLGITKNFRSSLADTFEMRRVDLVIVAGGAADQLSSEIPAWVVDRVAAWPEVEAVDAALVDLTKMETRDPKGPGDVPPSRAVLVQAWRPDNFGFGDMEIVAGRALTEQDTGKYRAMLGGQLAENLHKGVGDHVTIQDRKWEIVGVYKTSNVYETGGALTLLKDYQEASGRRDVVTGFSLRVRKTSGNDDADVEAVRQKIAAITDKDGKPLRLAADKPQKYLDDATHLKITGAMAWMISAIAVLIGVIGMLNTMAMSVLERTQEIGILRAVGWPRGRVVRMVLGEAVVLSLAAAVLGTVGAVAGTYLMTLSPRVSGFIEPGISASVIAKGTAITVVIGIVGGLYPAVRAARLLPTEAIRHD